MQRPSDLLALYVGGLTELRRPSGELWECEVVDEGCPPQMRLPPVSPARDALRRFLNEALPMKVELCSRLAAACRRIAGDIEVSAPPDATEAPADVPPVPPAKSAAAREPETAPEAVLDGARGLKEPSSDALAAYRLSISVGGTQKEIAEIMANELKRPVSQGQVSRWLKEVKAWLQRGNVLPDLPTAQRPVAVDPAILDMGARKDARSRHQRKRHH